MSLSCSACKILRSTASTSGEGLGAAASLTQSRVHPSAVAKQARRGPPRSHGPRHGSRTQLVHGTDSLGRIECLECVTNFVLEDELLLYEADEVRQRRVFDPPVSRERRSELRPRIDDHGLETLDTVGLAQRPAAACRDDDGQAHQKSPFHGMPVGLDVSLQF